MKRPQQLPRTDIEPSDVVARALLLAAAVSGAVRVAADHDDVADDNGSGGVGELACERLRIAEVQSDAPVISEVGQGLAGLRIQRVQVFAADGEDSLIGALAPGIEAACRIARRLFF